MGCGVEVTFEVIAAAAILRNQGVRVRVVNVNDLLILGETGVHPHALTAESFDSLFTADKPVIFNFHGFPKDLSGLLFSRKSHVSRSRVGHLQGLLLIVDRYPRLHRGGHNNDTVFDATTQQRVPLHPCGSGGSTIGENAAQPPY